MKKRDYRERGIFYHCNQLANNFPISPATLFPNNTSINNLQGN